MSPLEWLRRQRRTLSPQHRARVLEACDAMDAAIRAGEGPAPVAVIQIGDALSRTAADELRAVLAVTPRLRLEPPAGCGCWPRYVGPCRCNSKSAS